MEEEEKIVKGDDVIVDLDATLEDLYMGGSLKVILYLFCILMLKPSPQVSIQTFFCCGLYH